MLSEHNIFIGKNLVVL